MRSLRSKLVTLMALLLPNVALADPQQLSAVILEESVDPIWPVSGHVVVGVMGHLSAHPDPSLLLFLGAKETLPICAEIMSRSRNYRARLEITEPTLPRPGGVVDILDLTENRETLRQLAGPDLAVRATAGVCAGAVEPDPTDGRPEVVQLFIAGWGNRDEFADPAGAPLPDEVRLLVNARTSSAAVIVQDGSAPPEHRLCAREPDARSSGFDFICTVSLAAAKQAGLAEVEIQIRRANFGQREEPVPLKLHLYASAARE